MRSFFRSPFVALPLLVLGLMLVAPDSAHAGYLDAGAGSTFVQGIIAVFAAVSRFWRSCIGAVRGLVGGKRS